MDEVLEWPAMAACQVTRFRLLPGGPGQVLVTLEEQVEPETLVAQGDVPLLAGIRGRVVRVFPQRGVAIQGQVTGIRAAAGWGGEAFGLLAFAPPGMLNTLTVAPGTILIVPGELTIQIAQGARRAGVVGMVAASAHPAVAASLAGGDLSAILDGTQPAPGTAIPTVLLHGFGAQPFSPVVWQLLGARTGQLALLRATTQILTGQSAELLVALPTQAFPSDSARPTTIDVGAFVWIAGGDHDGQAGRVVAVLQRGISFPSGIRTATARVRLESGREILLPCANLQRIG